MDDKRLIEDYLPIEALSRENTTAKGHINTLHLWWARRPLVACRAAVYGALVPSDRWVKEVTLKNPPGDPDKAERVANGKKKGLNRKAAGEFVRRLCRYPRNSEPAQRVDIEKAIGEARQHVLEAHRARLVTESQAKVAENGEPILDNDGQSITESTPLQKVPPPKVLDMFAGGGAIPLEALRLGCDAYALDLNPVAHIIELCTLVYAQKYGQPDKNAPGMTGRKNAKGETTWGGLAEEVRYWGNSVIERVYKEIGDLYPPIPEPGAGPEEIGRDSQQRMGFDKNAQGRLSVPHGYLTPVAYLWTRTVKCKNPTCGATVPLLKQTWLCKKKGRQIALRVIAPKGKKQVRFEIVRGTTEQDIDFDPSAFSKGGNATCPFCGTVADSDYVKSVGHDAGFGHQPMAIMCVRPASTGKVYVLFNPSPDLASEVESRLKILEEHHGLTPPGETLEANPRSFDVQRYGFLRWRDVFTDRQNLMHLTVSQKLRVAQTQIVSALGQSERSLALTTCLALSYSRLVTQHNAFCGLHSGRETIEGPFGDGKFPMSWDYVESNPFSGVTASYQSALQWASHSLSNNASLGRSAHVHRGTATTLPFANEQFDAVITDPPYYDNYSYSNLADAFYVWLKRSLGSAHPEHFSTELTPKKSEIIKAKYRHQNDDHEASKAYEALMTASLKEASRVLKPTGIIAIVYAHKTTLGWSTLVDSLRASGFTIVEAWPLATEAKGGRKKVDKAMLASSIFLVARKRTASAGLGNHEEDVRPDLEEIVRERVGTLWDMGIAGADLVIAAIGAGLRAFTKYERVEYANGEEMPAEQFLNEVEGVVLDTILRRLSKASGSNGKGISLAGVDEPTRFYILWRYAYRAATLDAGEAIIFANGTHVELDGQNGLSTGSRAVVEKDKSKYRLRDFTERGDDDKLGLPDDGQPAPLIDTLHRTLWLMENRSAKLRGFLEEARPDRERMRLVAQALAGTALKGAKDESAPLVATTQPEQAALDKLTANWRSLIDQTLSAVETGLFGKKQNK